MSRYGERLRELRAERQLSLREVEERGGPSKDTMSLTERGVHRPHPRTLGKIAQAFGMSVSDLRAELEGADSPKASPLSNPQVRAWLRENGAPRGAMSDDEFKLYVLDLDPEISEAGDPAGIIRAVESLAQEADNTRAVLWARKKYDPIGPLLPVPPHASASEQQAVRHEELSRLRRDLPRTYRRRLTTLVNYANALAADQEARGKSPGYIEPTVGVAARRERMLEAAFAENVAG